MKFKIQLNELPVLATLAALLIQLQAAVALAAPSADRPNIVIILADDLGYADIGVFGCEDVPTPHIDSIANNGARFTDGYANHHVCSPSRAGLISGPLRSRFGLTLRLNPYDAGELTEIVFRSARLLGVEIDDGGAEEIAKTVLFLIATDFITGECIRVDGGRHLV